MELDLNKIPTLELSNEVSLLQLMNIKAAESNWYPKRQALVWFRKTINRTERK